MAAKPKHKPVKIDRKPGQYNLEFEQHLADQIFAQFKDSERYKTSKGTPEERQLLFAYCARQLNQMMSEAEHLATTALKDDLLSSED